LSDGAGSAAVTGRGAVRRRAFLRAAREVFLEQGFEAANMSEVVRRAGGSMTTLYAQFGSKEGLFLAIATEQHNRVMEAMTPDAVDHLPLEEGLQAIGERYLRVLLEPETLAMFRIVIGEGRTFPEHVRQIIFSGGDKVRAAVAAFMRSHGKALADADADASYFVEMLRSRHHYRALVDTSYRMSDRDIAAHVRAVVRFFLNGAGK
jgi:AcrR family transcriptional regulator